MTRHNLPSGEVMFVLSPEDITEAIRANVFDCNGDIPNDRRIEVTYPVLPAIGHGPQAIAVVKEKVNEAV